MMMLIDEEEEHDHHFHHHHHHNHPQHDHDHDYLVSCSTEGRALARWTMTGVASRPGIK